MFSRLFFRQFFDSWNDGLQGLLQRSDDDVTFIFTLAQYILLLQLARTMVFFYLSHFTSKLAEACKSFLEQCTQRGYC